VPATPAPKRTCTSPATVGLHPKSLAMGMIATLEQQGRERADKKVRLAARIPT
jgi:hypothetical protein